jgi:uncharacterized protein YggL (DUF469 family)
MESPRSRAKRLLVHYFQQIFQKAKLYWDGDNISEIEEIVDNIIDATIEQIEYNEARRHN